MVGERTCEASTHQPADSFRGHSEVEAARAHCRLLRLQHRPANTVKVITNLLLEKEHRGSAAPQTMMLERLRGLRCFFL